MFALAGASIRGLTLLRAHILRVVTLRFTAPTYPRGEVNIRSGEEGNIVRGIDRFKPTKVLKVLRGARSES